MISSKKLIKLAKRWQKFAAIRRKRISFPRLNDDANSCSTSTAANKGHFVVYTADQKRFVVPLSYLENEIIRQLLSMSEEEFGLPSDGPITLPCDAVFMDYIISLLSRGLSRELEIALLNSVTSYRCSSAPLHQEGSKKLIKLAKRWQKFASIRRKRISFPSLYDDADSCSTSSAVNKGHFTIYTADQKRFVVPLSYLENEIIRQLLSMSEEEFGLPSDGPITLPCDAVFMEYIISLLTRGASLLPAKKLPIITVDAPRAKALAKWPEFLIPPSAMTGIPLPSATDDTFFLVTQRLPGRPRHNTQQFRPLSSRFSNKSAGSRAELIRGVDRIARGYKHQVGSKRDFVRLGGADNGGLLRRRGVGMDDTNPTESCHGGSHGRLRNCIHRRSHARYGQGNIAAELRDAVVRQSSGESSVSGFLPPSSLPAIPPSPAYSLQRQATVASLPFDASLTVQQWIRRAVQSPIFRRSSSCSSDKQTDGDDGMNLQQWQWRWS
nr:uncharacterized protein LOC110418099 [Ipomoea trifida]